MTDPHLTPDQLDDYLIDPDSATPASVDHLAGCRACQAQLGAFHFGLAAFDRATLAWAEARSATCPRSSPKPLRGTWHSLLWSAGALACAALAFSTAHHATPPADEYAATASSNQIDSDNQLLANIHEAVETPVLPSATLLEGATQTPSGPTETNP